LAGTAAVIPIRGPATQADRFTRGRNLF